MPPQCTGVGVKLKLKLNTTKNNNVNKTIPAKYLSSQSSVKVTTTKIPVNKVNSTTINAGHQSEPSQSVAQESQQLLKYFPLPQAAPAVLL